VIFGTMVYMEKTISGTMSHITPKIMGRKRELAPTVHIDVDTMKLIAVFC
jgi:hypothetical protein